MNPGIASRRETVLAMFALLKPWFPRLVLSTVSGVAGGLAVTAMLAMISTALTADAGNLGAVILAYCGAGLLTIVAAAIADWGTNVVGQRLIANLRIDLSAKILHAPIDELERYRLHRLLTILNGDIDTISLFAFNIGSLIAAFAIITGSLCYLAFLSPQAFLMAFLCLSVGTYVQYRVKAKGIVGFEKARHAEDRLQKSFNAIVLGAKELRLDRGRRQAIFNDDITITAGHIRETQIEAVRFYIIGRAVGSALFFGLIAILIVWRTAGFGSSATLGGFVLVLLYVRGPIEQLIGILPMASRAQIAFGRIAEASRRFDTAEPGLLRQPPATGTSLSAAIEFCDASYQFGGHNGSGFRLGPIDLRFLRGEITFVTGDNGSGKTTLIKLLLGLYRPLQGRLVLDGRPILDKNRDDYRQLFAAVLSDFHLFEEVAAVMGEAEQALAQSYLHRLQLDGKVKVENGRFTTTDLSTGQRKRLAFIQACVQGRPVMVFDEWAADQDPTFRHLFYTELLPELRSKGKTLIVISHDDRYFGIADQFVRLNEGKIVPSGI